MAERGFGPASVKRTLRANGIRKGLLGGSRFWMFVFVAGSLLRWSGRATKRGEMPVKFSERLGPGEEMIIRHIESA